MEGSLRVCEAGMHMQVWGTVVCSGALLMVCYFLHILGAGWKAGESVSMNCPKTRSNMIRRH